MTADALLAMRPDQIEAALTPIARSLGGGIPGVPRYARLAFGTCAHCSRAGFGTSTRVTGAV
eukprot:scaffold161318_cov34-Tisochrysis_lutea.AAC.7